jgi:carboxylesterase
MLDIAKRAGNAQGPSLLADGLTYFRGGTNGKAVLLIHGITGSPVEMKYMAKGLHRAGYTVYAPLLAGHGVDIATLRKSRWQDWYRSVSDAANLLASRTDQIYVAGVCVGGMLGLHLARDNSLIRAATVYSPLLQYDGWNAPYHYRLGRITVPVAVGLGISKWINLKERPPFGIKSDRIRRLLAEQGNGIRGTLPAFPVDALHQNLKLFKATKAILPEISTRTLLIHAREDDLSGPRNPLYIQRNIGGPCEIEWLSDSFHMVHVDQEHAHVADRTRAFFDRAA